ncbi:helicase-exonuclease AddAB subunit AddA [Marinicrinis lubricantis]|uniref:ATP-dependent helicase/nuclease subunit A n=1 Tax=Marinicrinis lubricantis TaxID=2086470 RepID=A0ABW1IUS7_9BACL
MTRQIPPKPAGTTWTEDQWKAIASRNSNLLVAAAAGSGKTAVLVERIIRRITDEQQPVDVDRLLVATFTKAAADEMRHRIREALERQLEQYGESEHLRKQLALIHRAHITTLHSFCLDVIRENIQDLGIDPDFRIASEAEGDLLRRETMEECFEDWYGKSDASHPFWQLVDSYSSERSDEGLYRLVERIYEYSRSHPAPNEWLRRTASAFTLEEGSSMELWIRSLLQDAHLQLSTAVDAMQAALRWTERPLGPEPYREQFMQEMEQLERLCAIAAAGDWEKLQDALQQDIFGRLKPCRGDGYDKELQDKAKGQRDEAKKRLKKLQEQLFNRTLEEYRSECVRLAPLMCTFTELVQDFAERYSTVKLERGLLDFNDLEHYCLQVLGRAGENGQLLPTKAALHYKEFFAEVLIDEYQDTNRVQESILGLISKDEPGNRFMVGDVKQSIYGFRLAEPGLFLEKYKGYGTEESSQHSDEGVRIDLSRNFRSRGEVLDGVNYIFRQLMNEGIGEIAYDQQAELVCGADYPPSDEAESPYTIECMLLEKDHAAEEESASGDADEDGLEEEAASQDSAMDLDTARLEAKMIALQIHQLVGRDRQPFMVYDRKLKGKRPVQYRDIVILMRSPQGWAPIMMEEFRQSGIPCYADLNSGYFSAGEIEIMLSLLRTINNPYQDIPLAAVLRSPIYRFTAEEMALVRAGHKTGLFYDAVIAYGESASAEDIHLQDRVRLFISDLERWRNIARGMTVAELIQDIFRRTGYLDMVGGFPGGSQRQANLQALLERAKQYEATSFRGLFRFLRFIEKILESGGDLGAARALGEQEDVVRIMSIHKSKGLEFPVVFVAGLSKQFNQQDLNQPFLMHKELGFGPKLVDTELRISYPTLPNLAIRRKLRWEMLAEEMRVLYVALTRPKEKLFLVGTVKKMEKKIEQWSHALDIDGWALPDSMLSKANSYMDWLGPVLIRHCEVQGQIQSRSNGAMDLQSDKLLKDASQWKLYFVKAQQFAEAAAAVERRTETLTESLQKAAQLQHMGSSAEPQVKARLSWAYPYAQAGMLYAKTSVTEMKRLSELQASKMFGEALEWDRAEEQVKSYRSIKSLLRRPRFKEEQKLTPAEKGTLYHAVMQHIPLDEPVSFETVEQTIRMMVEKRLMLEKQSEVIQQEKIFGFFRSEIGQRLLSSPRKYRELPFSYVLKAGEVYPEAEASMTDEPVLIQGVIDCLFETKDGLVLVDYKTDTVAASGKHRIKEKYAVQIRLYRQAIEAILSQKVVEAYLYLFDTEEVIDMREV